MRKIGDHFYKSSFESTDLIQFFRQLNQLCGQNSFLYYLIISAVNRHTLESGIDVGQGINVGPGKFVKKYKRRALNKRRA